MRFDSAVTAARVRGGYFCRRVQGRSPALGCVRGVCILGRCALAVEHGSEGGRTGGVARDPDTREANLTKGVTTSAESARSYAVLSIVAAVLTIGLKIGAYLLTGSVGLFSDAAESVVNLVAAVAALWALVYAARPPDEEHAFGHNKAEYFSSGLESALIIIAAFWIGSAAWERLVDPQPLENVGLGLSISLVAAALNGGVALVILRAGRRLRSITLRADAQHLFTDVWTSLGVVLGIVTVQLTGWLVLDPLIGLLVAANIVWTGVRLSRDTASGLLDRALPPEDQEKISKILSRYGERDVRFHALRTRASGQRRFISMHILVPGSWTVQRGHDLSEKIERDLAEALPRSTFFMHLEPSEDPASFADQSLDRNADGRS
jgi:cation diffusion facilitator family transporter